MNALRPLLPLVLLMAACHVLEPPGERSPPPDVVLHAVKLDQYRRGEPSAHGALAELRYQRDAARAELDSLELEPLSGSEAGGRLIGRKGLAKLKSGTVDLTDGVRWSGADGSRLDTDRCAIDLASKEVKGPDPVTLDQGGMHASADRFSGVFGDERKVKLDGNVHATFPDDKPGRAKPATRKRRR